MNRDAIIFNKLSIQFHHKIILSELSLSFKENRIIAILGRSGEGKSCFLKAISGILPEEAQIFGEISSDFTPLRQQVSYMPQNHSLLPWLNVLENCILSRRLTEDSDISDEIKRASSLLNDIGLGKELNHYPHQLSGGMQQRLALARTLIQDKPIILMDEPFSSLDAITRHEIHQLAKKLLQHKTVLIVTHDPEEALYLADDIYILKQQTLKLFQRKQLGSKEQKNALLTKLASTEEIAA